MTNKINYPDVYFDQIEQISKKISKNKIDLLAKDLAKLRKRSGRLFFLGVGGSAANASHAVNDFRKLCNIECYAPTDNVAELTARINDEGWVTSFKNWLIVSKLTNKDAIFLFSVGGGNKIKKISLNLISAVDYAKSVKAKVYGVIGKKDGYANKKGDNVILIPEVNKKNITPLTESYQAVVWHCLVSHPDLQSNKTKW